MIIAASFDTQNPEFWLNRGLAYGDGLFETMRLEKGAIPLLDFHLSRLNHGLKQLKLDGFEPDDLATALSTDIGRNHFTGIDQSSGNHSSVVKLMVFRASQARTYQPLTTEIDWVLTVDDLPVVGQDKPLNLSVAKHKLAAQPLLAGLKHLSRVEQVMLADELNGCVDVDDLLLLNENNDVIETIYQNLILIKNNQLFTPRLNESGVSGVALSWLKSHFTVKQLDLNVEKLIEYDGGMVCNSIRGFRMVQTIQNKPNVEISFGTSHRIHDKINALWQTMFTS